MKKYSLLLLSLILSIGCLWVFSMNPFQKIDLWQETDLTLEDHKDISSLRQFAKYVNFPFGLRWNVHFENDNKIKDKCSVSFRLDEVNDVFANYAKIAGMEETFDNTFSIKPEQEFTFYGVTGDTVLNIPTPIVFGYGECVLEDPNSTNTQPYDSMRIYARPNKLAWLASFVLIFGFWIVVINSIRSSILKSKSKE